MKAPLRKIVKENMHEIVPGVWQRREVLSCGHEARVRKDIYGETNASSRRCKQCAKAALKGK